MLNTLTLTTCLLYYVEHMFLFLLLRAFGSLQARATSMPNIIPYIYSIILGIPAVLVEFFFSFIIRDKTFEQ